MKISKKQIANVKFFDQNLPKWLKDVAYKGKFVLISEGKLQKVYDRGEDAYVYAMQTFIPGEFIIKEVISEEEAMAYFPSVFSINYGI